MYNKIKADKNKLKCNKSYTGESLECKIRRILNNKEPITDGAPIIYTERKNGVEPQYNIRTDRFEIAIEAMDVMARSAKAKREQNIGEREYENMNNEQKKEFNKKFPENKHNNNGTKSQET